LYLRKGEHMPIPKKTLKTIAVILTVTVLLAFAPALTNAREESSIAPANIPIPTGIECNEGKIDNRLRFCVHEYQAMGRAMPDGHYRRFRGNPSGSTGGTLTYHDVGNRSGIASAHIIDPNRFTGGHVEIWNDATSRLGNIVADTVDGTIISDKTLPSAAHRTYVRSQLGVTSDLLGFAGPDFSNTTVGETKILTTFSLNEDPQFHDITLQGPSIFRRPDGTYFMQIRYTFNDGRTTLDGMSGSTLVQKQGNEWKIIGGHSGIISTPVALDIGSMRSAEMWILRGENADWCIITPPVTTTTLTTTSTPPTTTTTPPTTTITTTTTTITTTPPTDTTITPPTTTAPPPVTTTPPITTEPPTATTTPITITAGTTPITITAGTTPPVTAETTPPITTTAITQTGTPPVTAGTTPPVTAETTPPVTAETTPPMTSPTDGTTATEPPAPIPGDVDGNGIVTISDALEILMKLAGMESVAPDDVTINDALDILMHLAGMPSDMRIYGG
jgi:hypothetical protein